MAAAETKPAVRVLTIFVRAYVRTRRGPFMISARACTAARPKRVYSIRSARHDIVLRGRRRESNITKMH